VSETRVTINGLRHYICDGVPKPLPSVTSILTATQSEEQQRKLARWNDLNPGASAAAAERGTWIHNSVENHIRGLKVIPPNQYLPFWKGVPECLDDLLDGGRVLWSERPFNQPRWSKYVGDDGVGRIYYYDSVTGYGYAGCCDLIYMDKNAEIVLADFKTSNGPYAARFPKKDAPVDDKTRKALISGAFKTKKTRLQLAAYKLAAEACLGIKIAKTQILVTTAVENFSTQVFTFGENEILKDEAAWLALVRKYYDEQNAPVKSK
jgi:hypothetical protein